MAGQLGGLSAKAGFYAVVVLADNATFSLAVNRMVAFRTESANQPHNSVKVISQLVEHQALKLEVVVSNPTRDNISHMFAPTSTHAVGMELSSLVSAERATQMSHSLN